MTHDPRPPVSRLDLERLALGKLPDQATAELARRAAADPALAARASQIRRSVDDAAHDLPPLRGPLEEESAGPLWAAWTRWTPLVVAGALAAALGLLAVQRPAPEAPPSAEAVRFRGAMDLQLWRVRGGEARVEGERLEAAAGDRLQFEVSTDAAGWLSVFNLQEDGALSTYLPPTRLEPLSPAASAVQLDGYRGDERVFFVLHDAPVTQADVEAALAGAPDAPLDARGALPGVPGAQRSVLVVKP